MKKDHALLIVHGGAGRRRPTKKALKTLYESLYYGYELLKNGAMALDAVIGAITVLEDSGIFNAGFGRQPPAGRYQET